MQVEQGVVGGRGVDFEIAGVDDHANRSGDGQGNATHNGMRDVNEFDFEGTNLANVFGFYRPQLGIFNGVLFQPSLHQRQREGRGVNRNIKLLKEKRHCANVVFMAVGENQCADMFAVFAEISHVGRDDVDTE